MTSEGQTDFKFERAPVYKGRHNITEFLNALSSIGAQVAHHWWQGEFVDFHVLYEKLMPVEFRRFREGHDESSAARDFRDALHFIACDIRLGSILLDNVREVALTEETIERASACTWFDNASFRSQYAAGFLTRMSNDAAARFVHSERTILDAEIDQETSEHLQTPLQLCAIAITHGLSENARELCKQTWELTTGYVHRKDRTLNKTVDAIQFLVEDAPEEALRLLYRIAPQIHNILKYTDGKETRHVLADTDRLLAKLKPSALVTKYEEHTHAGDWSEAENSLQAYVEQGVKEGWPLNSLMRTGMHTEINDILLKLAQNDCPGAAELLQELREFYGWDIGLVKRRDYPSSDLESKPCAIDVSTFVPTQLGDFLVSFANSYNSLNGNLISYTEKPKLLRAWYEHWENLGQGRQLLETLDGFLFTENDRTNDVMILSDLAFQTRRKLSGPKAAWLYLVNAHIQNGAWLGGYAENEKETCNRLDLVAKYYPQRCDEFVTATTFGMNRSPERQRVAPSELMVYFYVRQKRIAEAVKFTETMVDCVLEDTRSLPLKRPRWAAELVST